MPVHRGVNGGTRTLDRLDHNQELYQLSYAHHERPLGRDDDSKGGVWPAITRRRLRFVRMGFVRKRGDGWSWDGVAPRDYASGAERHVLVGTADGATQVELRYFSIPAGAASNLEHHPHEHAILILHGTADVLLGTVTEPAGPGDVVFVAADEVHQLTVTGEGPLGFLCTALADRAPRPVADGA